MSDLFGIIGLILILCGWIYELISMLKTKKSSLPLGFAVLYGMGSLLLTLHSWLLDDLVFLILNGAATIIAMINIGFIISKKKR